MVGDRFDMSTVLSIESVEVIGPQTLKMRISSPSAILKRTYASSQ